MCLSIAVPGRRFVRYWSFADDAEEPVCDASEGSGVLVSAVSQRVAIRPANFVAADGGHGPIVGGVPEVSVRSEGSLDQDRLSRPFCDGRDAEVGSQGIQVDPANAVESFGEDDGQGQWSRIKWGAPGHTKVLDPIPIFGHGKIPRRRGVNTKKLQN